MSGAEFGSMVTVSYVGTLDNGRIFDSTEQQGPLSFVIGGNQVFPALEQAVIGMIPGEVKNIVLSAEQAYGPRRPENMISVPRSMFPADRPLTPGQRLRIEFNGGSERLMLVAGLDEERVTLDGNHPLAGQELTFALRLEQLGEGSGVS